MKPPIDITSWVFSRFKSERSGKWRMNLCGIVDGEARETSTIAAIDVDAAIVTTASGSRYRLVGPWVYATAGGSPTTLADILDTYGEWTPAAMKVAA